ncbi:MAG TPA: hypothetical protein DEA85_00860, partial [Firmicutes bacterium]|nr:hypothetical protein [Bacillota bacterium]
MLMRNLAKLTSGLPVLLILDQAGVVCYASRNLEDLFGNQAVKAGSTLPKNMLGWRQECPWETEVNGRALSFVAEAWTDYTLLLVTDSQGDFSGAATILNSIDEGIHVVNKHGQTVFYNPTMAKMEGMDYNQVINKDVLALFPSLTPETSTILRALRTREPVYDQVQTYF